MAKTGRWCGLVAATRLTDHRPLAAMSPWRDVRLIPATAGTAEWGGGAELDAAWEVAVGFALESAVRVPVWPKRA